MSTTLPRSAQNWAYLTHFDMTLRRTYTYRGTPSLLRLRRLHRPGRLRQRPLPLRQGHLRLRQRQRLTTSVARRCEVRG